MGEAVEARLTESGREIVPPEVRALVVEAYEEWGSPRRVRMAVRRQLQFDIDEGTIAAIVVRAGVVGRAVEKFAQHVTAHLAGIAVQKAALVEALMHDITELRAQLFSPAETHHWTRDGEFHSAQLSRPTFADQKQIVIAIAVLIDKVQLLTGEATARTELLSNPDVRGKAESVIDELAKRRESA